MSIELIERNNQPSVKVYQYSPRCKHVSASRFFLYQSRKDSQNYDLL